MKKTWPIEIDCPNCAAKLERALADADWRSQAAALTRKRLEENFTWQAVAQRLCELLPRA